MLQYKIPQNVEVEDTIIGPITMKQLIIIGIGGGLAYVFYITLAKYHYIEVWGPPVGITSLITILIAFVEIRGISFVKWFLLMIEAMVLPRQRVWDKRQSTQFLYQSPTAIKKEEKKESKQDAQLKKEGKVNNLEELTKVLDTSEILGESKKNIQIEQAKDHELASAALHEEDSLRHFARLEKIQEEEKIKAIRGDSIPLSATEINTQQKPIVPETHKDKLAKIK